MPIAQKFTRVIFKSTKPTLTHLILQKIEEAGEILLDSFFPAKYAEVRIWRKFLDLDASYKFKRPTFTAILAQLRAQGLIEKTPQQRQPHWRITKRGRTLLSKQQHDTIHKSKPDGKLRLVCFDIPEHDRRKRHWLRSELIAAGYHQLQKSVWVGKTPLPQEFITALDTLELRNRVHLLRVESEGALGKK